MVIVVGLVIGFDLDLTLVDSADGITSSLVEAGRRIGVVVEPERLRPLLGLPLEDTLRHFVDEPRVEELKVLYRELYPDIGVPATKLLPGAREAVESIHEHGGQAIVVSAKIASAVRAVLDRVGLDVDDVVGERFAETKGEALRARGADVFVGDHPGDMIGARSAGAYAMGVTTGSHDDQDLRESGANVVFADLLDFPYWLADFVATPT